MQKELNRPTRLDLSGQKIGRWKVLFKAEKPNGVKRGGQHWLCECECGASEVIQAGKLNAGRGVRGCRLCRTHRATIGSKQTPEYISWRGMKERCQNSNHSGYQLYGGRGISVCEQWKISFQSFLDDMGLRPIGHSLDRIDVNGNYEPINCRWADARTQARNTRVTRLTDGQILAVRRARESGACVSDLAEISGMSRPYIASIIA
jgi:hypothetical protein